jgi:hypothetical protein
VDPSPPRVSWTVEATPPARPTLTMTEAPAIHMSQAKHNRAKPTKHHHAAADSSSPPSRRTPGYLPQPTTKKLQPVGTWTTTAADVQLNWSDPDPSVTSYTVYAGLPPTGPCIGECLDALVTQPRAGAIVTPLLGEGPSCYYVAAFDAAGNESDSAPVCTDEPFGWPTIVQDPLHTDCACGNLFNSLSYPVAPFYRSGGYPAHALVSNAGYYDDTYFDLTKGPAALYVGDIASSCGGGFCAAGPAFGGVPLSGLAVLAPTCPTCGSIQVQLAGNFNEPSSASESFGVLTSVAYKHDINLTSSSTVHSKLFVLPSIPKNDNNSVLLISRLSGQPKIEGVGAIWPSSVNVSTERDRRGHDRSERG